MDIEGLDLLTTKYDKRSMEDIYKATIESFNKKTDKEIFENKKQAYRKLINKETHQIVKQNKAISECESPVAKVARTKLKKVRNIINGNKEDQSSDEDLDKEIIQKIKVNNYYDPKWVQESEELEYQPSEISTKSIQANKKNLDLKKLPVYYCNPSSLLLCIPLAVHVSKNHSFGAAQLKATINIIVNKTENTVLNKSNANESDMDLKAKTSDREVFNQTSLKEIDSPNIISYGTPIIDKTPDVIMSSSGLMEKANQEISKTKIQKSKNNTPEKDKSRNDLGTSVNSLQPSNPKSIRPIENKKRDTKRFEKVPNKLVSSTNELEIHLKDEKNDKQLTRKKSQRREKSKVESIHEENEIAASGSNSSKSKKSKKMKSENPEAESKEKTSQDSKISDKKCDSDIKSNNTKNESEKSLLKTSLKKVAFSKDNTLKVEQADDKSAKSKDSMMSYQGKGGSKKKRRKKKGEDPKLNEYNQSVHNSNQNIEVPGLKESMVFEEAPSPVEKNNIPKVKEKVSIFVN